MPPVAFMHPGALAWWPVSLGAPLLGWGALACAIPVVVHFVMRQKSQHQVFPALRFLMQIAPSGKRAQRLKYILLLACRMMLILLVVGILARTACSVSRSGGASGLLRAGGEPVSAVICLDDSASMGYRFQGRTRFQQAADWAQSLVQDAQWFAPGSEFAIVAPAASADGSFWTSDTAHAIRKIESARGAYHDHGITFDLEEAFRPLGNARNRRQEVYLFTDLTRSSWRVDPPKAPEAVSGIYLLDVGEDENLNVALGWPSVADRGWRPGIATPLGIRVRTGDLPAEPVVEVAVDGQTRDRQVIGPLAAQAEREITITVPAIEKGIHTMVLDLQPDDALKADNKRFAHLVVDDPPRVLLLADAPGQEVASMLMAMIAPAALAPADRRYTIELRTASQLGDTLPQTERAVILADLAGLDAQRWGRLATYVEGGGTLVVVPGPHWTPTGYQPGESLLPAAIRSVAACPEPVTVAATDLSHPLLRPFADTATDSINSRPVFQRLELGPVLPPATIVAPFSDGQPALLSKRVGKGEVVLLAFSPASQWSLFGSQAAPMIVLLQTLLANLTPANDRVASLTAGQTVNRWLTDLPESAPSIVCQGLGVQEPVSALNGRVSVPTAQPGAYRLQSSDAPPRVFLDYTVNVAESESELARVKTEEASGRFPPGLARVVRSAEELKGRGDSARNELQWLIPLALALLALLFAESLFANRFYGFSTGPPTAG